MKTLLELAPSETTLTNLRNAVQELKQVRYTGGVRLDGKNAGEALALAAALVDFVLSQTKDKKLIKKEFSEMQILLEALSQRIRKKQQKKKKRRK